MCAHQGSKLGRKTWFSNLPESGTCHRSWCSEIVTFTWTARQAWHWRQTAGRQAFIMASYQGSALRLNSSFPVRRGELPWLERWSQGSNVRKRGWVWIYQFEKEKTADKLSLFTDWKRLRTALMKSGDGMIEPAGDMIMFDYIVNGTEYLKAGCYIAKILSRNGS